MDAHLASAAAALPEPLLVIADDTAHLTSMRHDLFQLARARASHQRALLALLVA